MPRVAVISDVHGNLSALESVLEAIQADGCDEVWFLGDAVGYGAKPEPVCQLLKRTTTLALVGNHDLAVIRPSPGLLARFNTQILPSLKWMLRQLSAESLDWLSSLPSSSEATVPGIGLYHGSPRDPVWEYVRSEMTLRDCWAQVPERLILVGHSHVPFAYAEQPELRDARSDDWFELDDKRWVINPGSVGQPRDGDWRAAYLLLDLSPSGWRARFRRVNYDVTQTMNEIYKEESWLLEIWAARLALGQ